MEEPINSLVPLADQFENLISLMHSKVVLFHKNLPKSYSPQSVWMVEQNMRMIEVIKPVLDQLVRWDDGTEFSNEHQSVSTIDVLQCLDYTGSLCTKRLRMAFYRLANGFVKLGAMRDNQEDEFVLSSGLFQSPASSADADALL